MKNKILTMLWWPFNTKNETEEVTKKLPDGLKEFFQEQTPDHKAQSIFEISPQQEKVNKTLQKYADRQYSYEFDRYKQTEKPLKVATINCAEIQEQVLNCFRGYSFTTGTQCKEEIGKVSQCMELQAKALKKLHYEDCVEVEQCDKIRYIVDKLFTDNFGQFGDLLQDDQNQSKFNNDLDKVFYKIWK